MLVRCKVPIDLYFTPMDYRISNYRMRAYYSFCDCYKNQSFIICSLKANKGSIEIKNNFDSYET